ncbi:MAG: glycosyltransferase family 4 protein [Anaerolineae bacterium]
MRIGLVIYGSLDTVSGGYLYDRMLVAQLRAAGDSVEIVSLPWRNYGRHLADNLSPALHRRLRDGAWDVLLQDELNHPSLFLANRWPPRAGKPRPCPIISIVHHLRSSEARPAWQNRLYRWVERRYLAGVDGFIFNSATTQGVVQGLVGAGRPGIVAHPGRNHRTITVSPAAVAARAAAAGPLRVLFIGNLIPRKGLHTVLDALARLPQAACRLTVVGSDEVDPAYAAAVSRQIIHLGLTYQVELLGALPDEALNRLLAESHVLAVPSSYEGYGIVYAEALGHGLPVIASIAGAAHEIVAEGREGFLVAPGDAAAIAAILGQLSRDRAALARMSQAALARYAALPTWAESAARVRAFLVGCIQTTS